MISNSHYTDTGVVCKECPFAQRRQELVVAGRHAELYLNAEKGEEMHHHGCNEGGGIEGEGRSKREGGGRRRGKCLCLCLS